MEVQAEIDLKCDGARVFAAYADVPGWPRWDPDTRAAQLDGPLRVGSKGWLQPTKGRRVPMAVIEVTPGRSFTVRCAIPGLCMVFEHRLTALDSGGVRVLHRAQFSGWLSPLFGRLLVRQLRQSLPITLQSLGRYCAPTSS